MKSSYLKYAVAAALVASSVAYVATVPTPTEAATPFTDIPANSSHLKAIDALYNKGYITGRTAKTYAPSASATRAEAALFIANALELDQKNVKNPGFADVPTTHPQYGAIAALANLGVISGSKNAAGKTVFSPNNPVKRAHIGKMLTLGFELEMTTKTTSTFADVNKLSDVKTRQYIQTLADYKIAEGRPGKIFAPYENVTRAQLATFLYRALEYADPGELEIIGIE